MALYIINPNNNNTSNAPLYHSSHPSLQQNTVVQFPTINISETGLPFLLLSDGQVVQVHPLPPGTQDLMVNNNHTVNDVSSISNIPNDSSNLSDIIQTDENCFLIPYLHMIQSQLDFPMDYQKFLACIPPTDDDSKSIKQAAKMLPLNIRYWAYQITNGAKSDTKENLSYTINTYKWLVLLYSNQCFPIYEKINLNCNTADNFNETGYLGFYNQNDYSCGYIPSNGCGTCEYKKSIRVTTKNRNPFTTLDEVCKHLQNIGPLSLTMADLDMCRLRLVNKPKKSPEIGNYSWEDLVAMSKEEIENLLPPSLGCESEGHAITVVSCNYLENSNTYVFTVLNSWDKGGRSFNISISANNADSFLKKVNINPRFSNSLLVVLQVEECSLTSEQQSVLNINNSPEAKKMCLEQECKRFCYDGIKDFYEDDECPCKCDTVVNSKGEQITKVYQVGLFDNIKKCRCPECAFGYGLTSVNCDCSPLNGAWCVGYYTSDSRFIATECRMGDYSDYLKDKANNITNTNIIDAQAFIIYGKCSENDPGFGDVVICINDNTENSSSSSSSSSDSSNTSSSSTSSSSTSSSSTSSSSTSSSSTSSSSTSSSSTTVTPTPTPTPTSTLTATPTSTLTATPTSTLTATPTSTLTATPTSTPTATSNIINQSVIINHINNEIISRITVN